MKAFVTGASGFIGSYLVKALVDEGHEVLCLKRLTSKLDALDEYVDRVKWVDNTEGWMSVVRSFKPYIIYHLAWNGVAASDRIIWKKQVSNVALLQELLDLALEVGCKKIVSTGSQSEYGDFENKIDESYPVNPKTAYAAVKVASQTIMKSFCEINGIDWYWFRLFPLFGPHEADRWLIPSLIKSITTSDHMDLTPGEQQLSYLYVGECAKAIMMAIYAECKSGVYNICSDNPVPLRTLVEKIRDKINLNFKLNFGTLPYRYGQCMYMEGDTIALRTNIYDLKTSDFDEKLDMTVEYYLKKYDDEKK
jgi:nucleoside-diphosphate-sugar epimerase